MSFASDCDAVPALAGASKRGLRALNAQDVAHVSKRRATKLSTSVDIDTACKASQPTAARWDYGVAQRQGAREIVHWIEVHPAAPSHRQQTHLYADLQLLRSSGCAIEQTGRTEAHRLHLPDTPRPCRLPIALAPCGIDPLQESIRCFSTSSPPARCNSPTTW